MVFLYKGKKKAVVGGGDSAIEEAVYLAKLCSKVYLVHREIHIEQHQVQWTYKNIKILKKTTNVIVEEVLEMLSGVLG